jgi:hypothetical protein
MYFYHVLNDYSLELIPDDALYFEGRTSPDPARYKITEGSIGVFGRGTLTNSRTPTSDRLPVAFYHCLQHAELHYLRAEINTLDGVQL